MKLSIMKFEVSGPELKKALDLKEAYMATHFNQFSVEMHTTHQPNFYT